MANNKIGVEYTVNDKGSIDKLKKKTDAAAKSTGDLANKKENYNRQEKGSAGLTSNSTKAFSKMQQGIDGGLVPAYATLAANVFAVTAAFGVLQRAAATQQLEEGLLAVGRAAGANLKLVSNALREVTDFAISTQNAMESVAIATSAGFSEQQIVSLGEVAKGASLALGRDMADAMTRLTRGTSKLEPELLDELGIFVKLGKATQDYADTIGVSVDTLTEFERRQAFVNAAIKEGQEKFGLLNLLVEANPYDRLASSFSDLTKTGLNFLNNFLAPVAGFLADFPLVLFGAFGMFATGIVNQIIPSLESGAQAAKAAANATASQAKKATKVISSDYKNASKAVQSAWKTVPDSVAKLEEKFKKGTYSAKELKTAITRLAQSEKLRANAKLSSDPKIAKARAEELEDVRALKREMIALQKAESKRFSTSEKGKALGRQSVGSGLTSRGMTEMGQATTLMQKFSIATRYSGFQLQNVAKASSGLTKVSGASALLSKSMGIVKVSATAAAGSVKLFGSALLSALPMIGQVIMIGSLLWEGYKWLFEKKPSLLDKELEKAQTRYAEFPNIISQMATAYNAATTRAQAFASAMKPTVGLLKQTNDQITAIINAEKNVKMAEYVKAQTAAVLAERRLKAANEKVAKLKASGDITVRDETDLESIDTGSTQGNKALREALNAQAAVSKSFRETQAAAAKASDAMFSEDAHAGVIEAMIQFQSTQRIGLETTRKGTSEYNLMQKNLKEVGDIITYLTKGGSIEVAAKRYSALATQGANVQNSFDSAGEAVSVISNAMTKATAVSGPFATVLTNMAGITEGIKNQNIPEVLAQYASAFKAYGIEVSDALLNKKAGDTFSKEETEQINAAARAYEKLKTTFEGYNETAKKQAITTANIAESARQASLFGNKSGALAHEMLAVELETLNAKNALHVAATTQEGLDEAILRLFKAQTAELVKQAEIRAQQTKDATRLGGATMGAGAAFSETAGNFKDSGGFDSTATGIASLNETSKATIENLKALGPEGEALGAVFSGALNATEAWSTAFTAIGAEGATAGDKIAAGMQAVGATINAISGMQQANAKAHVAAVDRQIAAEQRRDGKSKESLAKIAALEKKKEAIERKAFEQKKKMQMAEVVMATGVAIMNSIKMGLPWGAVFGGMAAAMGAAQLSAISSQTFDGGSASAPQASSISVGNRQNTVDLAKANSPSGELSYARGAKGLGNMSNFTPAFTGHRAAGGNTAFVVGEQGPELFVPDRPGSILPSDETQAGAGSTPVNVSFNINTVDNTGVEDLLTNQRGYIIGMIREAANAHGETFLESVDDRAITMENN